MHRFGTGSSGVLILGGIHGDETAAVELAQRLLDQLARDPQACAGRSVFVIPVANPDGVASRRRVNANGVDLNRNFPAANFKPSRRYGVTAASQPETRALLSALEQVRPALIISIHCADDRRKCNSYDGPAEAIASLMSRHNGYPVTPTIGYPTPGSLGSYAGIDRGIGVITLELPRTALSEPAWTANRDAILAAIGATE
jgi:protein MpaA